MHGLRDRVNPTIDSCEAARKAVRASWGSWVPLIGAGTLALIFFRDPPNNWLVPALMAATIFLGVLQFFFQFRFRNWAALLSLLIMCGFLVRSIQMTLSNGFTDQSPVAFLAIQGFLLWAIFSIWNGYRGTRFITKHAKEALGA